MIKMTTSELGTSWVHKPEYFPPNPGHVQLSHAIVKKKKKKSIVKKKNAYFWKNKFWKH